MEKNPQSYSMWHQGSVTKYIQWQITYVKIDLTTSHLGGKIPQSYSKWHQGSQSIHYTHSTHCTCSKNSHRVKLNVFSEKEYYMCLTFLEIYCYLSISLYSSCGPLLAQGSQYTNAFGSLWQRCLLRSKKAQQALFARWWSNADDRSLDDDVVGCKTRMHKYLTESAFRPRWRSRWLERSHRMR